MKYTADDYSGYVAEVTYDGVANYGPTQGQNYNGQSRNKQSVYSKTQSDYVKASTYKPPFYVSKYPSVQVESSYSGPVNSYKEQTGYKAALASFKADYDAGSSSSKEQSYENEAAKYKEKTESNTNYKSQVVEYKESVGATTKGEESNYKSVQPQEPKVVVKTVYKTEVKKVEPVKQVPQKTVVPSVPVVYKPETIKNVEPTSSLTNKSPWTPVYAPSVAPAPAAYRPAVPAPISPVYKPTTPVVYQPPATYASAAPAAPRRPVSYRVVPASSYRPSNLVTNYPLPAAYRTPNNNRPIAYRIVRRPAAALAARSSYY